MANKIWFLTGASKGIGLALIKRLLVNGCKVIAVTRTPEELMREIGVNDNLLPLGADLTKETEIKNAIDSGFQKFGGLDVVVNNAVYLLEGAVEEFSDIDIKKNFEVNLFAQFSVIRHSLHYLRERRSGYIINIASLSGYRSEAFSALYSATKFAVDGMTEGLADEVKQFGIHAISVLPGGFRTNFLTSGAVGHPEKRVGAYQEAAQGYNEILKTVSGTQSGDPDKAAALIMELTTLDNPPVHIFFGKDSNDGARAKIADLLNSMNVWKDKTENLHFSGN